MEQQDFPLAYTSAESLNSPGWFADCVRMVIRHTNYAKSIMHPNNSSHCWRDSGIMSSSFFKGLWLLITKLLVFLCALEHPTLRKFADQTSKSDFEQLLFEFFQHWWLIGIIFSCHQMMVEILSVFLEHWSHSFRLLGKNNFDDYFPIAACSVAGKVTNSVC